MAKKYLKRIHRHQFYEMIAERAGIKKETVEKVWMYAYETALDELILQGNIALPYFGTMRSEHRGGKIEKRPEFPGMKDSPVIDKYIEPYVFIRFKASEGFHEQTNGREVTPLFKREQKAKYRKALLEQEESERQRQIVEKRDKAWAKMLEDKKKKDRKARDKFLNPESSKGTEADNTYWDDYLAQAESFEESQEITLDDLMD